MKVTDLIKRPTLGLLLLASAAGGPYVLYETDAGKATRESVSGVFVSTNSGDPFSQDYSVGPQDPLNHSYLTNALNTGSRDVSQMGMVQTPVSHLGEVLRFDITPTWVMGRFPRVSTVLADLELDGVRVPLVTGSQPTDLAGTLTYYFDRYQRLQRIKLHGVTGDPSRCVAELQRYYQFQQEPALGGGLYTLKWNGQAASVLHVAPAPVIYADAPYSRFNIFLELNQAGLAYGLSDESQQLIAFGRHADRW